MPVDTLHPAYATAGASWAKCRTAAAGQKAVHAAGAAYLPKLSEQTDEEYKAYVGRALFYNATARTVDGLTGLIFRRPPKIEIPAALDFLLTDSDAAGKPAIALCENAAEEVITVGRVGLLADYPMSDGVRTLADERASGAKPYIKVYCAETITNWRVAKIANRWQLSMVVLKEEHEEATDDFQTVCIPQWRVLRLNDAGVYTVEIWRKSPKDDAPVLVSGPLVPIMGGKPMNFIPFVICGPMGVGCEVSKPPIEDLVDVNLSHYRTTADYEHGLHFTGLPTPIITGHQFIEGEKFSIGSTGAKAFANPEAKAFYLEFTGEGLKQLSTRLAEKEQMMVALGARMLASDKRQVEAAETAAIHRAGENSVLASLAIAVGQALSQAFTWCAMWAGVQESATVTLNTDYLPAGMTAQELTALVGAWQTGAISHETLYDNLQRGEIAQQGVDFTTEQDRLSSEGPALGDMTNPGASGGNGQ